MVVSRYRNFHFKDGMAKIDRIRNSVYYKLIARHAAQATALRERFNKSKIRNLKSQIMSNDSIGLKRDDFVKAESAFYHPPGFRVAVFGACVKRKTPNTLFNLS